MTSPGLTKWPRRVGPAVVALVLAAGAWLTGLHGSDLAAQAYRNQVFALHGMVVWDSAWYGGNFPLGYSVLGPAFSATLGLGVVAVVSAGAATACFDRTVVYLMGGRTLGSWYFAVSTLLAVTIGQVPYLSGEALALGSVLAIVRGRPKLAVVLGVGSVLFSPLAGAFLVMVCGVWAVHEGALRRPLLAVGVACSVVVGVLGLAFPGSGRFPFAWGGLVFTELLCAVVVSPLVPTNRTVRLTAGVYAVASLAAWVVPNPVGGDAVRLAQSVGIPVVACIVTGSGRWRRGRGSGSGSGGVGRGAGVGVGRGRAGVGIGRGRAGVGERGPAPAPAGRPQISFFYAHFYGFSPSKWAKKASTEPVAGRRPESPSRRAPWSALGAHPLALGVVALLPFLIWQWAPGTSVVASASAAVRPSTTPGFYRPLVQQLTDRAGGRPIRVEVVPTVDHWETAYVAPYVSLARGWERQLDVVDNPIFYAKGAIGRSSYRSWLVGNGVTYVALPQAPLDYAGRAEGALLRSGGVRGLTLVWSTPAWRLWRVDASPGLVSGPGRLTTLAPDRVDLDVAHPGTVLVRVRFSPYWRLEAGSACVAATPAGWTDVRARVAGPVRLAASLIGGQPASCPAGPSG